MLARAGRGRRGDGAADFRRDGSLVGRPRMTYVKAGGGDDGVAALATSIFAALQACTPLQFTPGLGAVIAGRTFTIRFVAPRRARRAALPFKGDNHG